MAKDIKKIPGGSESIDETAQQAAAKLAGLFPTMLGELNVNADQLNKRKAVIRDIEKALSDRYKADNRLISYIVRFDHPKGKCHLPTFLD